MIKRLAKEWSKPILVTLTHPTGGKGITLNNDEGHLIPNPFQVFGRNAHSNGSQIKAALTFTPGRCTVGTHFGASSTAHYVCQLPAPSVSAPSQQLGPS